MVNIAGHYCIDRWEAITVDAPSGLPLSPYYPPDPRLAHMMFRHWSERVRQERKEAMHIAAEAGVADPWWSLTASDEWWRRPNDAGVVDRFQAAKTDGGSDSSVPLVSGPDAPWGWVLLGDAKAPQRARPVVQVPTLPTWQSGAFSAKAMAMKDVIPQGYTPGFIAKRACRAAGKRLCREGEWVTACKGERGTKFPYGPSYRRGRCNVFQPAHPAQILHGSFSIGLSDPRLNLVKYRGQVMLHRTGQTRTCASKWGDDAVYDMVGNVDEWVDDPGGLFVGGFYARNTRNGCEARVHNHPLVYFDYSLGFRCCADLVGGDESDEQELR